MKIDEDNDLFKQFYDHNICQSENPSEFNSRNENNNSTFAKNEIKSNINCQIQNNFLEGNDNDFSFLNCNNKMNNDEDELLINENKQIAQNNKDIKEIENTITTNKGRVIKTKNETTSNILKELFATDQIDLDTKTNMQLIKTKNRRRTKKEILFAKSLGKEKEIFKNKKSEKKKIDINRHSKIVDDNIIKKIDVFYPEKVRNWLNSSFLDENGNFLPFSEKFLKMKNTKIYENLKREKIIKLINTKFKEIFSNNLSEKYKTKDKNINKELVKKIYEEKNQCFIEFILDLTFIQGLDIFSGEINFEDFKALLRAKNIRDDKIKEFYDKFDKIDVFLKKIYSEEIQKEEESVVKEYIQRISILCLNYKNWFERKSNRKNQRKKE